MYKIQRISNFQSYLPLFVSQDLDRHYQSFLETELGRMYKAIPWKELVKAFKLKDRKKGPKSFFSPEAKIALMFLKIYSETSDKKLVEQINGNIHYQFFCGIRLKADQWIKDYKIVSQIRCELAEVLDIKKLQSILAAHWRPHIQPMSKLLVDATCYESSVRYPTNQKLLWESVSFLFRVMKSMYKKAGIKLIRTKYRDWESRYKIYSRRKRKSKKEKRALTRGLLKLLDKLNRALDVLEREYEFEDNETYQKQRKVIEKVLEQQQQIFTTGIPPKNRIVSLFKPYLRPIVRGKEVKKVEFGAKINKLQIDGISFIQYISFDPFNECTQFKDSIYQAQKLTKVKVRQVGADAIYATNANRRFATSQEIRTDFVRKGKAGKNEEERKKVARKLRKERSSVLEGSFGNEKEHYLLKKIKARTEKTEKVWIFFGIHTANAVQIGHRMSAALTLRKAA